MKNKSILFLFGALVCGLLAGYGLSFLSPDVLAPVTRYVFDLPCTLFVTVLRYVAGPLIFLCIVASIYSCGDLSSFGRIGKNAICRFLILSFASGLFSVLFSCLFFGMPQGAGTGENGFLEVLRLFTNFIPENPWDPFLDCNLLQITFMSVITGFLLLLLGKRVKPFVKALKKAENALLLVIRLLGKVIPVYVFLCAGGIVLSGEGAALLHIWQMFLCFVLVGLILAAFVLLRTKIVTKTRILTTLRNILPPFMIALSTANSTMALDEHFRTAEEKHGVTKTTSRFAVPLAMSVFKPASVAYLSVIACYMAKEAGLTASFSFIFSASVTATLLTFSIPPIPGGGLNCYTVLFYQLGIPDSFLSLALSIDPIMEFPITGLNNFAQPPEIYILETKRKRREQKNAVKTVDEGV